MSVRFGLALVLVSAMPSLTTAQGFEYVPGTSQYRITQATKVTQEAMGQKQEAETSSYQLITVTTTRPHRDTLGISALMDSVSQTGPMGPTPGLEKLVGVVADAKLSPAGAFFTAWVKDSTVMGATGLSEALGRFLPRIRSRLAPGAAWSDTSAGRMQNAGLEIDRKTLSRYVVAGDTTIAGVRSWKLLREDSTTMSGTGLMQGQAISMEGTSTGKGALFVSQEGVFLGGGGDELSNIKLVLSANGLEINVVQSANSKIEKVK